MLTPERLGICKSWTNTQRYLAVPVSKKKRAERWCSLGFIVLIIKRSAYKSSSSHEPPFPTKHVSSVRRTTLVRPGLLAILKLFSSSLICWASIGVKRLHVAISPRRSYSWLGHVSKKTIRGLNVAFRFTVPWGVPGELLESWRSRRAETK